MRTIDFDSLLQVTPRQALNVFYADAPEFTCMGIPTLLLRPENYQGRDPQEVQQDLSALLESFCARNGVSGRYEPDIIASLAHTLAASSSEVPSVAAIPLRRDPEWAHDCDPEFYREPEASIIIAPHPGNHTADFDAFYGDLVSPEKCKTMPGTVEERIIFGIFHECIHCTGAAETPAEKEAAILHKRSFGNNAFLKLQADIRAVRTIFDSGTIQFSSYGVLDISKTYSWGMCEALDDVVKTPRDELLGLTEEEIKSLRFESPDPNYTAASNVGFIVRYAGRSFPEIAKKIESEIKSGQLTEGGNKLVAERFLLACKRLHAGGIAYTNTEDPYDITPEAEKACSLSRPGSIRGWIAAQFSFS